MRPESFTYHSTKAKQLLDVVSKFYAEQKFELAQSTIMQIMDLMTICLQQTVTKEFMEHSFPNLEFNYNPISNYTVVTNRDYELTRDQAIYTRNLLLTSGYSLFEVHYEGNGVVDWDTKDDPDYLVKLQEEFGSNWRIKRSETNPYKFFFTVRTGEMTYEAAVDTGTTVKRRYPNLTIQVYYGNDNPRKYVIVDTWTTSVPTTPENDPNPHDTGT